MKQIVSLATVDAFLELDSLDRAWSREYEFGENESGVGLGLVWFREGLCSVHVSIFLPRNSSLSYWRITIENRDAGRIFATTAYPASTAPYTLDLDGNVLQTRGLQGNCTVMEATPDASLLVLGLDNGVVQGEAFPQVPEIPL